MSLLKNLPERFHLKNDKKVLSDFVNTYDTGFYKSHTGTKERAVIALKKEEYVMIGIKREDGVIRNFKYDNEGNKMLAEKVPAEFFE